MQLIEVLKGSWIEDAFLRRTPVLYHRFREDVREFEFMDLESRRRAIRKLVAKRLAGCESPQPRSLILKDWPLLSKEDIRGKRLSRGFLPTYLAHTGGSTGIPLALRRSWSSIVFEQAVLDHFVQQAVGFEWRDSKLAVLRGDNIKEPSDASPPFWRIQKGGQELRMSANHLGPATVNYYLEALEQFKPDILWVYPSTLASLLQLGVAQLPATTQLLLSSSEVLQPELRRQATQHFKLPILDYYGQAERVALSRSVDSTGLHKFSFFYGAIELLHSHESDGTDFYEIVATSLWNSAQPLVRYRTGDFAAVHQGATEEDLEKISLGLQPFLGILGRDNEYILSPAGTKLVGINQIARGVPGVLQMQFHQLTRDSVAIHVLASPAYGKESAATILRNARSKIPSEIDVRIEVTNKLWRTKANKTPLVVRHI